MIRSSHDVCYGDRPRLMIRSSHDVCHGDRPRLEGNDVCEDRPRVEGKRQLVSHCM